MTEPSKDKPKDKSSPYHVFLIVTMIGCALFMGFYLGWSIWRLQSYHLSMDISKEIILEYQFTAYMTKFGKIYNKNEFPRRLKNFKASVSEIQKLNKAHHGSAKFGFTQFSDLSKAEYPFTVPGPGYGNYNLTCDNYKVFSPKKPGLPTKVDWRERGVVGKVLSQGKCMSCWAHCVVGIMESRVMIKNLPQSRQYSNLSIQELIDCSTYTNGCNPGNPVNGLDYLCVKHLPIVTAYEYPLTNKKGDCGIKSTPKSGVLVSQYAVENNVDPYRIAQIVAEHGPVTTIVNAMPWIYYLGGIIQYHCSSSDDDLNHVVQIVGYNMEAPVPYFILRNSWGTHWGDHGYLYTSMTGICGVGKQITYVDVDII